MIHTGTFKIFFISSFSKIDHLKRLNLKLILLSGCAIKSRAIALEKEHNIVWLIACVEAWGQVGYGMSSWIWWWGEELFEQTI